MVSSVDQKQQDLIHGYIKEEIVKSNEDDSYPLVLNKIVAKYLGNIFFRFDIVCISVLFLNYKLLMSYYCINSFHIYFLRKAKQFSIRKIVIILKILLK